MMYDSHTEMLLSLYKLTTICAPFVLVCPKRTMGLQTLRQRYAVGEEVVTTLNLYLIMRCNLNLLI